eukprot:13849_1
MQSNDAMDTSQKKRRKRKRKKAKRKRKSRKEIKLRQALRSFIPFSLCVILQLLSDDLCTILNFLMTITNLNLFAYDQLMEYYSITENHIKQNKLFSNVFKYSTLVDYRYLTYNINDIQIKKLMANQNTAQQIKISHWSAFDEEDTYYMTPGDDGEMNVVDDDDDGAFDPMHCLAVCQQHHQMFRKSNSFSILSWKLINYIGLYELCEYLLSDKVLLRSITIYLMEANKTYHAYTHDLFEEETANTNIVRLWMVKNSDYSSILRVSYSKETHKTERESWDINDWSEYPANDYFKADYKSIVTNDYYKGYINKCIKCNQDLCPVKTYYSECVCCAKIEDVDVQRSCSNDHIICGKCHKSMNKLIELGFVNISTNNRVLLQCKGDMDGAIKILKHQ